MGRNGMALLVLLAIASSPALSVEVIGDGDRCSLGPRVVDALNGMVAGAPAALGKEPAPGGLRVTLRTSSARVEVLVVDARGETGLRRELPLGADACAATADGVALVVDRYLRDIGWELPPETTRTTGGGAGRSASASAATSTPTPTPTPTGMGVRATVASRQAVPLAPVPTAGVRAAAAAPEAATRPRWRIGARGLAEVSTETPTARAGAELLGGARWRSLVVGAAVAWFAPNELAQTMGATSVGSLRVDSLRGRVGAGLCRSSPAELCAVLHAGVERFAGEASGTRVFQQQPAAVWRPTGALELRWERAIVDAVRLYAAVEAVIRPMATELGVEGASPAWHAGHAAAAAGVGVWVQIP